MRILLLGGTGEAAATARLLAEAGIDALYSYAGRTPSLAHQPLPVRVGGFGGAGGLADFIHAGGFTHVIDATHPFAAQISRNAVAAARQTGARLIALERPGWRETPGDDWTRLPDYAAAAAALPRAPTAVFLAIGRQNLAPFAGLAHRWLLRFVAPDPAGDILPGARIEIARGPFTTEGDLALMRDHGTQIVVAKDAGGTAARAKLEAARILGLPVLLIRRPSLPARQTAATPEAALALIGASIAGTARP